MKRIFFNLLMLSAAYTSTAQTIIQRDPLLESMVKQVSSDSLRSYITTMVSFGTRNTLSTQKDRKTGIGAAREWVLKKFIEFAAQSGGRMTAIIDTTTIPADGRRVDAPVLLGNVMATLKGSDPNDKRIFLISGHLDSRATDVMNKTIAAPGANDDGSGVAAVIECARETFFSEPPFLQEVATVDSIDIRSSETAKNFIYKI